MKKLFLSLLLFSTALAPATAQKTVLPQDAISTFFSSYVDDPDFTAVYVSGKVFELFRDSEFELDGMEDDELKAVLEVVRDIQGIRVLTTEKGNPRALYRKASLQIPKSSYELLFKVRTADGENVEAFIQDDKAVISELFMLVGAEDNFTMLSFIGAIDLRKISDLQRVLE